MYLVSLLLLQVVACQKGSPSKFNRMPESLHLVLNYSQSGSFSFNLLKIPDEVDKVKVVVGDKKGSHVEPQDPNKHFSFYRDSNNYATFTVTDNTVENGHGYRYYGTFLHNRNAYTLEPITANDVKPENDFDKDYIITIDKFKYHLRKKAQKTHGGEDNTYLTKNDSTNNYEVIKNITKKFMGGKQILTIEVLVVLDYSIYSKWMKLTNNNQLKAVENIRYYFSEIVNGIKMRYDNINMPGYLYTVALSGFYIAERPDMAPFIENSEVKTNNVIRSVEAIKKFSNWISKDVKTLLPRFDVAVLFTNYDMTGINGLAFVSGVCNVNGVSINRDNGPFQSADTAAHEIGHNLGSHHDGGTNGCTLADQYIMAPSRGELNEHNLNNPFHFSQCSLAYFSSNLQILNSKKQNCMEDYPESSETVHADKYFNGSFGQTFSLDYQCKIVFGPESYPCSHGNQQVVNICYSIGCHNKQYGGCSTMVPASGTSCGLKSWCFKGRCIQDNNAPTFRNTCLLGDSTEMVYLDTGTTTCKKLILKNLNYCGKKEIEKQCCESCIKAKNPNNKNCIYGDQHLKCNVKYCKSPYYRIVCCKTCDVQHNDQLPASKCDEEARISWCNTITGNLCYQSSDRCCIGCAKFYDPSVKGCEYGDKGEWCADRIKQSPDDCKSVKISEPCCQSCRNYNSKKHATTVKPTSDKKPKKEKPKHDKKPKKEKPTHNKCQDSEDDCSSIATSFKCYNLESECCHTCKKFKIKTNSQECRYGDIYEWCPEFVKEKKYCDHMDTNKKCCSTCQRYTNTK